MARLAGQEASAAAMGAAGMFGMAGVTSAMPSVIPGAMPMPGALGAAGVPGLQLPTALPTPLPGMMPGAVLPGPPGMSAAPASATVLPGSAAPPVANGAALEQGFLGSPSPIPTRCLLLKNLFDAAAETEPEWWIDIAEDVKEECGRHGPVDHIFVDKDSKVRTRGVRERILRVGVFVKDARKREIRAEHSVAHTRPWQAALQC